MRWRLLVAISLVAASVSIVPAEAFELARVTRSVGANIVATGSAYSALTIQTCVGDAVITVQCDLNRITNKGTEPTAYRIAEEADGDPTERVSTYGIDGGATVSTGFTAWSGAVAIGSTINMNLNVVPCPVSCGVYYTNWTIEGQKAGSLEFTATRVMIIIDY